VAPELLQDYLSAAAELRPEAAAVTLETNLLTFAQLADASSRLARLLLDAGCARGDRICLLLPKSPIAVVAMHGTLKADCAFVPLDTASPPHRLASIIERAEPALVLTTEQFAAVVGEAAPGVPVGSLGRTFAGEQVRTRFALEDLDAYGADAPVSRRRGDDMSHILFTSGSTGTPKGVVVTHRSVIHFVEWARMHFELTRDDRLSGHSPFHFDLSTFDIFGALSVGAELHLVPPAANLLAAALAAFIRDHRLTQWFSVPSAMTQIASGGVLEQGDFPELRRVIWCGDVLPAATLMYWMDRLPEATFTNLYGPTETTIASSYFTVRERPRAATEQIPIGRACPGEELLVLDERLEQSAPEAVGDLYISGAGLSPGYWRDPEATEKAFLEPRGGALGRLYRTGDLARRAPDGLLYFVGRDDSQIKSRGHRIELGEIEAALGAVDGIAEYAVVSVDSGSFEATAICCAYVARDGTPTEPASVKRELRRFLPGYMLPSRWLRLDTLPRNANGKTDRPALRALFQETRDG
jgi:amino acid adenylation domain-containing protein